MWTSIVNILVGLWIIVSPAVLRMNKITSDNNHVVGPLIITFSVISLWEINRNASRINIVLGVWLLVALFVLDFTKTIAFFSNGACGTFVILFSSLSRKVTGKYGGGWKALFDHDPQHLREAAKKYSNQ